MAKLSCIDLCRLIMPSATALTCRAEVARLTRLPDGGFVDISLVISLQDSQLTSSIPLRYPPIHLSPASTHHNTRLSGAYSLHISPTTTTRHRSGRQSLHLTPHTPPQPRIQRTPRTPTAIIAMEPMMLTAIGTMIAIPTTSAAILSAQYVSRRIEWSRTDDGNKYFRFRQGVRRKLRRRNNSFGAGAATVETCCCRDYHVRTQFPGDLALLSETMDWARPGSVADTVSILSERRDWARPGSVVSAASI